MTRTRLGPYSFPSDSYRADILQLSLFSLSCIRNNDKLYFSLGEEIYPFIDRHWYRLCTKPRTSSSKSPVHLHLFSTPFSTRRVLALPRNALRSSLDHFSSHAKSTHGTTERILPVNVRWEISLFIPNSIIGASHFHYTRLDSWRTLQKWAVLHQTAAPQAPWSSLLPWQPLFFSWRFATAL